MNREYTLGVISQTHVFWKALVAKGRADPSSIELAVGDVPITNRCFIPPRVESENAHMRDALEEVVEALTHKRHQTMEVVDEEKLDHDSKRVELVSVTVA